MPLHPRLARLPARRLEPGLVVIRARGTLARGRGLAGMADLPAGHALEIPRCRAVHTFGMRFALDLVWLGARGEVVRLDHGVERRRQAACRAARAVLETRAGEGARFAAAAQRAARPP